VWAWLCQAIGCNTGRSSRKGPAMTIRFYLGGRHSSLSCRDLTRSLPIPPIQDTMKPSLRMVSAAGHKAPPESCAEPGLF
jgi:hypothetical protein